MNVSEEVNAIINFNGRYAEKLYSILSTPTYNTSEYDFRMVLLKLNGSSSLVVAIGWMRTGMG